MEIKYFIQHMRLLFLVLMSELSPINGGFVTRPENEASQGAVTLSCGVSQPNHLGFYLSWFECISGTCVELGTDDTDADTGDIYTLTNATIVAGNNRYNLSIDVSGSSAGQYRCTSLSDSERSHAEVIHIASDTSCSRTTTFSPTQDTDKAAVDEEVTTTCFVDYTGRWGPEISFNTGSPQPGQSDTSTPGQVKSSFIWTATEGGAGAVLSSRTYFTAPNDTTADEASNAPSYENIFTFSSLTIYYGCKAGSMVITESDPSYVVGSTLTCSGGDCSPAANNYTWVDSNSGVAMVSGSTEAVLTIASYMAGSNQSYYCTISNYYYNTNHPENSDTQEFFVPTVPTTPTTSPSPTVSGSAPPTSPRSNSPPPTAGLTGGAIAGITIGCIVFVALVVLLILFLIYKQKNKDSTDSKSKKSKTSAPKTPSQVNTSPTGPEDDGGFTNLYTVKQDINGQPGDYSSPPKTIDNGSIGYGDVSHYDDVPGNRRPIQSNIPPDRNSNYSSNSVLGAHGYDNSGFDLDHYPYTPYIGTTVTTPDTAV